MQLSKWVNNMKKIFFLLVFYNLIIFSRDEDEVGHVFEGNLALKSSQEPGPLFCFGQTVIDKGDKQLYIFADDLGGKNNNFSDIVPYFIYGVSDKLAISCGFPFAAKFKSDNYCSSGIEDIFIQAEYSFYNKDSSRFANQATFLTALSLPTGSTKKTPNTGLGSPTLFFGLTATHTSVDWYVFGSPGILFNTGKARLDAGQIYYYQFGFGRNLYYLPHKRLITLILEFFGASSKSSSSSSGTSGTVNKNLITSGFYIGPSLWISTPQFIFNPGIAFNVSKGKSSSDNLKYFFAVELGYKFN